MSNLAPNQTEAKLQFIITNGSQCQDNTQEPLVHMWFSPVLQTGRVYIFVFFFFNWNELLDTSNRV